MFNAKSKDAIISSFKEESTKMFDSAKGNYKLQEFMKDSDVDGVREIVKKIQSLMIGNIPEGVGIPKVSLYITPTGDDEINFINLKITNRIKSEKTFSFAVAITKDKAVEKVFDFMQSVYEVLILDELIDINLTKVNDVLAQAVTEAGVDYAVKVVSPLGNEGKKIASMADDEIVFVADEERAFSLDDIIVLLDEPTEILTEEVIENHYQSIVEEMSTAQTPEQLVGIHGGVLVAYVCDISKRVKPITLIKKVCNKNVFKLHGNKDTMAYYLKDDVFALVVRRDDDFEVILSPFDVNTLHKVDVDVLKTIA